ncbi:MAG TPA: arylamine N-acetyltransferase [Fimbriimonadaceae bacterium]|nr:arylamine N-acetyltransferase [Fimbriimonadaceae bacterium]
MSLVSSLASTILQKLDLTDLENTPEGLRRFYRTWCLNMPMDNLRKLIALRDERLEELPGATAEDYFSAWLEHGTGGTCWPGSNALFTLAREAGFNVRRATGSVFDMYGDNHGTTIVSFEDGEYVIDSSFLFMEPLPIVAGQHKLLEHPVYEAEIDPEGDTFFFWAYSPPHPEAIAFKLLERDVTEDLYRSNYERSRGMGPFNAKIYSRKNREDRMVVLWGNRRFVRDADGVQVEELDGEGLKEALRQQGYSEWIIGELERCGAIAAALEAETLGAGPRMERIRPSQRTDYSTVGSNS